MKYKTFSFRNAKTIFENDIKYIDLWNDVVDVLDSISDEDIINKFENSHRDSQKSISDAINKLIDERLTEKGWNRQSPIFKDSKYRPIANQHTWTLDFSKEEIAIEVAFNHGSAVAWNLIKPVLSGELNHVEKDVQTSAGIIISATDKLKSRGNFDNAIGSYEKYLEYLDPLRNMLTVPMMVVGLEPPESFYVDSQTKQITDISEYTVSKNMVLTEIKQKLTQCHASYTTSSKIFLNGKSIPISIKIREQKIAIINKSNAEKYEEDLENAGWNVLVYDSFNSVEHLNEIINKMNAFINSK